MEDYPSGNTPVLTGAAMAQDEEQLQDEMLGGQDAYANQNEAQSGDSGITALELRLATRFAELVGGTKRAKEIIDKVSECQQTLGVDEQIAQIDTERINAMADMMPFDADLPTQRSAGMPRQASDFSSLYNPSADMRPGT
jgi:hypothetical protein